MVAAAGYDGSMEFRWNDWNLDHATLHGVTVDEAEAVVQAAKRPFPRQAGDGKWFVWGRGSGGRLLQVMYILDDDLMAYIIHARPLTPREARQYRRR